VTALETAWQTEFATVEADLKTCGEDGQKAATRISGLEEELKAIQADAALIFDLETAEERVVELTAQIDDINERLGLRKESLAERQKSLTDTYHETVRAIELSLEQHGKRKADLAPDIEALRSTLAGDKDFELNKVKTNIGLVEEDIAVAQAKTKELHGKLGAIAAQLADLAGKEKDLDTLNGRVGRIDSETIAWKVLARACSNDGIIALEVDDSGPSISAIANDLLSSCYGPRFSVRMETQAEKTDGDMKNVFDLTVFDSERDQEKSIKDMSGGEVTTIEDAVVRAFNLFNLGKGDRHFATIFTDEKDGALSQQRKEEFFSVKRKALEIGRHEREFFISQTSELQDAADARIVLGSGGVAIR
jgi:exonuclease SbcC